MNTLNTIAALEALIRMATQIQAYSTLVLKARAENRDITPEEMLALRDMDDAARIDESAAISAARAREAG